jgi:hypothetical protein
MKFSIRLDDEAVIAPAELELPIVSHVLLIELYTWEDEQPERQREEPIRSFPDTQLAQTNPEQAKQSTTLHV